MITAMARVTVVAGREEEYHARAVELMRRTHAEDDGVIAYAFHRSKEDPRVFVLFEQWRDRPAVDAHLAWVRATGIPGLVEKTEIIGLDEAKFTPIVP
jgi:quinol monooxygenase YgiN